LPFAELFDQGTEAHGKAFGIAGIRQAAGSHGIQHADRDPPVGPCRGRAAGHLDHRGRDLHFGRALGFPLQPLQETALETQACRLDPCRKGVCGQGRGILFAFRRALRQIGEEQGGRCRCSQSARHGHGRIGVDQFQRLIRVAGHEVVEVGAQRAETRLRGGDGGTGILGRTVADRGKQLFYGVGEFGDAFEADNGQGAMRLMHAGTCLGKAVACRVGGVGGEALARTFEGKVDLSLDPGQRADIQFHAHEG
jgi:hypothetical protein